MSKYTILKELVQRDHIDGCGQSECDITAAFENGQLTWSAHLLLGSGAASEELERLYKQINPSKKVLDRECAQFIKDVPHSECAYCGSVNWNTEPDETNHCWNCAKTYTEIRGEK